MADTFEAAVRELENVNSRDFWASETSDGKWDVQLSPSVVVYDITAKTVMEAVRTARWKAYLDKSFKSVNL